MRLIDPIGLKQALVVSAILEDKKTIEQIIDEQPTIEERKRGEWIPEFDGKFTGGAYWFSCSKCKRIVPEVRNGGWNFCPHCGADMRGGQDERMDV